MSGAFPRKRAAKQPAYPGVTALDNLVLLCRRHHRLVHEGGYSARREGDGSTTFIRPNGWSVEIVPAPAPWSRNAPQVTSTPQPDALGPTRERLAATGIVIDANTAPRWDGTPFNVGYVIDALRGHEPLLPRCAQANQARDVCAETS